ncbi:MULTISPECIES: ribosomal protection-like ABC-F family protein [Helicobacter]|uniref:ribosomal protection-like ABC-F family protein n=1 Tax=Helicobacter TaxID=209 RepID=UPI00051D50E1|nr:ABC-F family ATP-binding cassette domain-containing protein [Helicobacter sp. MIT 03-1616]TLD89847.1 ABC transporter ATP-binding protein [Helicobacter sp. MIT 03-1616]
MNLLSLQDVSKQYEHKIILNRICVNITKGEKIAIVGQNGSGKSSLLGIISAKIDIDSGERISIKNLKILSLPQKPIFPPQATTSDVLLESMSELKAANERVEALHKLMATNENLGSEVLEEYERLSAYLSAYRGWDLQGLIEEILTRFELETFRDRLANSLSGGEQKRIALASLLLQPCDILLLDEPTNHLDVQMVEFLEDFIASSGLSVVFISHDRYFIDKVATRIIELDNGAARSFDGGYMDYLAKKAEILQNMDKAHQKLLKILKSEEEWLRRGVKARLKRNEGRKDRILAMREEVKKNPAILRKMRLELEREQKSFNSTQSSNNQKCLFEIEHLHKSIGGKCLIDDLSLRILARDKIGIVGRNGTGKSSLLKLLLREQKADSGLIKVGDIRIGYFDQHTSMLEHDKDLLETFCPNGGEHINVRGKHMHVYGYLKNFLFPKEQLFQKIGALSGGERNRVALALLFTKEVDVFILDEPTNDLDIQTINIIEEYLLSLSCAVIFVSHDRYFVDKLAQKILVFEGNGKITQSYMPYSEYLQIAKELNEITSYESAEIIESKNTQSPQKAQDRVDSKKPTKLSYKENLALQTLPKEIEELEKRQKDLQEILSNPKEYEKQGVLTLAEELAQIESTLDTKITQYLLLEDKMHALH